MIKSLLFYFTIFLLLFYTFSDDLHAQRQNGTIRGVVTDSTSGVREREHGELDALEHELAWLARVRGAEDLGERSRGDLVFLVGVLHTYLALAHDGAPPACDHAVPPRARVVFRDLSFEDVLAAWD